MFERFTPRARRVIVLAQDAARDLGHAKIGPEHLLIGLRDGEGMTASAMAHAGVDGAALRARVAGLHASTDAAKKIKKVPFSVEAKQCLEQSLRAALALGHNYIGTEHLFFGVQRQAEMNGRSLDELLAVSASEIHRRLDELLGGASPAVRSPALQAALDRARSQAGQSPMTTGDVLAGMLADPHSQACHALAAIGVDLQGLRSAVDSVNVADTSDASPAPQSVAITIGEATTVLTDPHIASALQHLDAEELREIIKRAIDSGGPSEAAGQP
jgi:ATP-dependent Clp protease ATP-binding subunit ClpA